MIQCHSPTAILNFRAERALGRRQIRNESWDVLVVPCSFGRVSAKFLIFAKSCRKSTPKKSLSTLEQALVRSGNNCVVLGSATSAFLFVSHGVCLMLISFNDERGYLSLGSPSGLVNYYHSVSLWTLLHVTMVSSVDVHCKRDSLGLFSHLDVSDNELLPEIDLSWSRLPAFGLESGKCKTNQLGWRCNITVWMLNLLLFQ